MHGNQSRNLAPPSFATTVSEIHPLFLLTAMMLQNTVGIENQRPQPAGEGNEGDAHQEQPQSGSTSTYSSRKASDHGDATIHNFLVPGLEELDVNVPKKVFPISKQNNDLRDDGKGPPPADEDRLFERERALSIQYLLENVAEFRELAEIRKKVNENPTVAAHDNGY